MVADGQGQLEDAKLLDFIRGGREPVEDFVGTISGAHKLSAPSWLGRVFGRAVQQPGDRR